MCQVSPGSRDFGFWALSHVPVTAPTGMALPEAVPFYLLGSIMCLHVVRQVSSVAL